MPSSTVRRPYRLQTALFPRHPDSVQPALLAQSKAHLQGTNSTRKDGITIDRFVGLRHNMADESFAVHWAVLIPVAVFLSLLAREPLASLSVTPRSLRLPDQLCTTSSSRYAQKSSIGCWSGQSGSVLRTRPSCRSLPFKYQPARVVSRRSGTISCTARRVTSCAPSMSGPSGGSEEDTRCWHIPARIFAAAVHRYQSFTKRAQSNGDTLSLQKRSQKVGTRQFSTRRLNEPLRPCSYGDRVPPCPLS